MRHNDYVNMKECLESYSNYMNELKGVRRTVKRIKYMINKSHTFQSSLKESDWNPARVRVDYDYYNRILKLATEYKNYLVMHAIGYNLLPQPSILRKYYHTIRIKSLTLVVAVPTEDGEEIRIINVCESVNVYDIHIDRIDGTKDVSLRLEGKNVQLHYDKEDGYMMSHFDVNYPIDEQKVRLIGICDVLCDSFDGFKSVQSTDLRQILSSAQIEQSKPAPNKIASCLGYVGNVVTFYNIV